MTGRHTASDHVLARYTAINPPAENPGPRRGGENARHFVMHDPRAHLAIHPRRLEAVMITTRVKRGAVLGAVALGLVGLGGSTAPMVGSQADAALQIRQIRAHSSNYSARSSRTIRYVVIHTVEGSESSCINWFQNPKSNVSAHYVVSHAGRITQMVPDMSVAWHAGNSTYNAQSIGIENEGYAGRNNWTDVQYRTLADLVRHLCDRYGIPKDRTRIIGHNEVPRATHGDPGRHFDWNRFMNLVRGGSATATTPQTPAPAPQPATTGTQAVEVTVDSLNVRTGVMGTIIGQVTRGQQFVATASSQGWYKISFGNRDGWVSGSYVRRVTATAQRVTASTLNVRGGASTSDTIIGQTSTGRHHVRVQQSGDWFLVQFDGRRGWVHGGYTSTVSLR
ncbi:MAG: N-acetylmuramoyl-L-alanine amidase [Planctomycetota bacterium]|nr:N-acetylmuramoyl-L-alanine amidase [Planctomycetota bacterium]